MTGADVAALGAYDLHSIGPLAHALEIAAATHARVVLDASAVTFTDSTFLDLLLHPRQTDLRVAGPSPQLRRVVEMTGADTVRCIRATV